MKFSFLGMLGLQPKAVPNTVREQLLNIFPNAINIDWERKGEEYEAIFYLNDVEHIARFSQNGNLNEYKKNLWPEELSGTIAGQCKVQGEIMNAIVIYRDNEIFYEIIIRDNQFKRTLFIFSQDGSLTETRKL